MYWRSPEGDGDGRHEGGAKKSLKTALVFRPVSWISPTGMERSGEARVRFVARLRSAAGMQGDEIRESGAFLRRQSAALKVEAQSRLRT